MESQLEGNSKCVCELSQNFRRFSPEGKQGILDVGKPCPALKNLASQTKKCKRYFNPSLYEKYEWLCGCSHKTRLFSWPCALFSVNPQNIVLASVGVSDVNNLRNIMQRHSTSKQHIGHSIQWKTFGRTRIDRALDDAVRKRNIAHNNEVRKNREILRRLISAVCFLSKQELAFRGHEESGQSLNRGNYIELLQFLAEFDKPLAEHLESSTAFKGISAAIQNDLIASVREVLSAEISQEIRNAPFAFILVDEQTHQILLNCQYFSE